MWYRQIDPTGQGDASVWLVNLYYGPTLAPTGRLLESVATQLRRTGLRVDVVTGNIEYNAQRSGSRATAQRFVRRIPCGPFRGTGTLSRLLAWLFFYFGVTCFAFTRRMPTKILIMTTPPFLHLVFVLRILVSRRKAELILWNQDTYPDILGAVKLLKTGGWLYRRLQSVQKFGVTRLDKVIVLDRAMQQRMAAYGAKDVRVIPNWEYRGDEEGSIDDPALKALLRTIQTNYRYLILYSGNYGWGHDLSMVGDYVRQHATDRDFFFLFVGGGAKWDQLQALHDDIGAECLAVVPYISRSCFVALLRKAHFGLVALERDCVGLMSPSKIHSYLMAGVPLIYVGPAGSNVDDAIETFHCGFRIDESDRDGFARCLDTIRSDDFNYGELSEHAATAAEERYTEHVGVRDILEYLDLTPHLPVTSGTISPQVTSIP